MPRAEHRSYMDAADPASSSADVVVPAAPTKPSYKTGEFYVTLTPVVLFVLALFKHPSDAATVEPLLAGLAAAGAAVYAWARTNLKATHVKAAQQAAMSRSAQKAAADRLAAAPPVDVDELAGKVAAILLAGPATVRPRKKAAARRR